MPTHDLLPLVVACGLRLELPVGPVAQGIEQQPSKLKVAGSNPAGVASIFNQLAGQQISFFE